MKSTLITLAIATTLALTTFSGTARADADDAKWIAQCVKDNKDEGAKESVVKAYCECMNDKMSATETRSVTEFEAANPGARKACEKKAGWK